MSFLHLLSFILLLWGAILTDLHKLARNVYEELRLYSFKESYLIILEHIFKNLEEDMALWVKVFVAKPDNREFHPRTHVVEEKDKLLQVVS